MIAKVGQRWKRDQLIVEVTGYETSSNCVVVRSASLWDCYAIGTELKFDIYKFSGIKHDELCFEYLPGQDKPI